jgi:hypothetical protein
MRSASWSRGSLVVGLLAAVAIPGAVHASAVTFLDHLVITRNPLPGSASDPGFIGVYEGQGIYYVDTFSNGLEPPSAGSFAFQIAPPSYFMQFGAFGPSDESGGKLRMDSSKGGLSANAAGQARRTQQTTLTSNTDIGNPVAGLKQSFHTFSVYGLFDLTPPPNPIDAYGIQIQDNGPGLNATEELGIQLRRNPDLSFSIRSFQQDFVGDAISILDEDLLVIPAGADQIEFRLQRATLGSDLVTAAYRFWDDGSPMTAFTVMDGATDFFNNRGWARAGFRAVEAVVPEPGTLALLFGALGVLAFTTRRRSI